MHARFAALFIMMVAGSARAEDAAASFDAAIADQQAGRCEAAIPALESLVKAEIRESEAGLALRDCLYRVHGLEGAVAELERKVAADPGDAVAKSNLGVFYMVQQRRDDAQRALLAALTARPTDADARLNLAWWYAQVGQSRAAVAELTSVLKEEPENRRALTELCALVSQRENDPKRAEPYCARAAAGQETNEIAGVSLGLVRMQAGDLDGAERAFLRVVEANPDALRARTFYGVARLQRGDLAAAEAAFQAVLAKSPEETDARVGLARTFQAKKEFGKAIEQYRLARRQDGGGLLVGALAKAYLQKYFAGIVLLLLLAMGALLYKYLNVRVPPAPDRPAAAAG